MIEQFQCPHCRADVTAEIIRAVLYTLASEGNTVEAIQIPVTCPSCGTAMMLSVTPRVSVQNVMAVRVVPGDPEKWQAEEEKDRSESEKKKK